MLAFIIRRRVPIHSRAAGRRARGLFHVQLSSAIRSTTCWARSARRTDIDRLRVQLGLDQPFVVQYWRFLEQAAQGNFGLSYRQGRPVIDILLERLPATLELALVSGLLAIIGGIGLGIYTAIHRRGIIANTIMTLSLIGVSLPTFLIGIRADLRVFAVELGWLPSFGRGEVVDLGWLDDRFPHVERPAGAHPAGDHARPLSDDTHHASGAHRDARSAADRLRAVRARARHALSARSTSATHSRTRSCR